MRDDDPQDPTAGRAAEDGAAEVEAGPRRRSLLRHALASGLTTLVGLGIALAVITDAYAGPSHGSSDATPAPTATAVQQYVAPAAYALRKPKRDVFRALVVATAPDDDDSAALPGGTVAPAGEAQRYAARQVADRGWAKRDFACLVSLWSRESGWNAHAGRVNGPYGIPQAYPGTKMASAGAGWVNDHRVQIRWGLGYIAGRYGTPCKAWANSQAHGSY